MSIPLLKDSVVHVAYQFCLVMVLSLHVPLFCNVYPFEFDYSNLEVSGKKTKIKFKFCQFADARKRQHFLMLKFDF